MQATILYEHSLSGFVLIEPMRATYSHTLYSSFNSRDQFNNAFVKPIKFGKQEGVSEETRAFGDKKQKELDVLMDKLYLRRTKAEVLGDILPKKTENIVFCELSPLQKRVYEHVTQLPDFVVLRKASGPCMCGVNAELFEKYKSLPNKRDRIDYLRRHKDDIVTRRDCCFRWPGSNEPTGIDRRAVLWLQAHDDNIPCKKCPYCYGLPALNVLYKLSSHLALLQVKNRSSALQEGTKAHKEALKEEERARALFPQDIVSKLPGGTMYQEDTFHGTCNCCLKCFDQGFLSVSYGICLFPLLK
jgi:hypothetical protein